MIVRWESNHDYVLVHVHQDMFGDWIVSQAWGQIGTQFGGLKHMLAEDYTQAMTWVDDVHHIQTSRGFHKVFEVDSESPEGQAAMHQLSLLEQ